MKELDVFFEAFVARGFDTMAERQLPCLEALLEMQDQDLLAGLLGDDALIRARAGESALSVARIIRDSLAGTRTGS